MKHVYSVLVLILVLVVASAMPLNAGIMRGEGLDQPGTGGGTVVDGDHPWGDDEVIGGGGTKTFRVTVLTGIPIIDVLIATLISPARTPQSATLSNTDVADKSSSAVISSRKHFLPLRREK